MDLLSRQAKTATCYDERTISKLPRWVLAGGWALAFVAGIINVVGLLGFEHQAVTNTSNPAASAAASNSPLRNVAQPCSKLVRTS